MTGYRVTFDASHKVKTGGGHGQSFLQHIARDIDNANGVAKEHANPNIDPTRTHLNVTVVPDGAGGWVKPESIEAIADRLASRLATVKKEPRTDAVIMRPWVANLSPEWFAEHNPDWREVGLNEAAEAAYDGMLDQMVTEAGGPQNIVVASLHMDESLPQWQVGFTPVTDDGRLTQKPWFPSPTALREMGVRVRRAVAATGVAVDFKPSERSREHLSGNEFQRRADMLKGAVAEAIEDRALAATELAHLEASKADLDERESDLDATEATLDTRVASLEARRTNLDSKGALLVERQTRLAGREAELEQLLGQAETARQQAVANEQLAALARTASEFAKKEVEVERDGWHRARRRVETYIENLEGQPGGMTAEDAYDLAGQVAVEAARVMSGLAAAEAMRALRANRSKVSPTDGRRTERAARVRTNLARIDQDKPDQTAGAEQHLPGAST